MTNRVLEHDWFDRPLPANLQIGRDSWLYSSFSFVHYQSRCEYGVRVGHDSGMYNGTFFDLGPEGRVEIGNYCTIVGAIFSTNGHVKIGDYTFIAHEVVFADRSVAGPGLTTPDSHRVPRSKIHIGENVWIGARAVVIGNVQIGEGSIVGAATNVTDIEIPPFTIFAGNPARQIGVVRRKDRDGSPQ
jgi:acetyltransferase-like isoleucine patch superfamily enzyme